MQNMILNRLAKNFAFRKGLLADVFMMARCKD